MRYQPVHKERAPEHYTSLRTDDRRGYMDDASPRTESEELAIRARWDAHTKLMIRRPADESMGTMDVIRRIKAALQKRSGKAWSVTRGRGTACGWITIDAPPARRTWRERLRPGVAGDDPAKGTWQDFHEEYDTGQSGGCTSRAECAELAILLGFDTPVHCRRSHSIPSSYDYYREYIDRAEGRTPEKLAEPYWD